MCLRINGISALCHNVIGSFFSFLVMLKIMMFFTHHYVCLTFDEMMAFYAWWDTEAGRARVEPRHFGSGVYILRSRSEKFLLPQWEREGENRFWLQPGVQKVLRIGFPRRPHHYLVLGHYKAKLHLVVFEMEKSQGSLIHSLGHFYFFNPQCFLINKNILLVLSLWNPQEFWYADPTITLLRVKIFGLKNRYRFSCSVYNYAWNLIHLSLSLSSRAY